MQRHFSMAALLCLAWSHAAADDGVDGAVKQYVDAVARLKSYDVVYRVHQDAYNKDGKLVQTTEDTMRDVFTVGIGRRVEHRPDDSQSHVIAVIDWETAASGEKPLSLAIGREHPGRSYLDYLNPNCRGYFLVELLSKEEASVQRVKDVTGNDCVGLEVTHPHLNGPIRLWLDPRHGYMPATIEMYLRSGDGSIYLDRRSQIDGFFQVGQVWVPGKAKTTCFVSVGPPAVRPSARYSIAVIRERMSVNSTVPAELFSAASLPSVTRETFGWKEHYPDAFLPALKKNAEVVETIRRMQAPTRSLFIAVNVVVVLLVLSFVAWRWRRRRHAAYPSAT